MKYKPRWYRKFLIDVDKEVVREAVAKYANDPEKYSHSPLQGPYLPEDSQDLNGKKLVFRGEGRVVCFEVGGLNEMYFSENGGEVKKCYCNIKTMDNEIYFINQLIPGYEFARQITLIADMKTGSATICDAHFGTPNSNVDVDREFIFGKLDGDFEEGPMHEFTNELVGTAVEWNYGKLTIKHMYTSNLYYTYSHPGGANGAWMATNPADYVKVRDNIYIFSFVEERQHGLQGLFLIDLNQMHDVGSFFGVSPDHLSSNCIGAKGTLAELTTIF